MTDYPLTRPQQIRLLMLAAEAYESAKRKGADAGRTLEEFRRDEMEDTVQKRSLKDCRNSHFRRLRAAFYIWIGETGKAFADLMSTGPSKTGDTYEQRETAAWLLTEAVAGLADAFHRTKGQDPDHAANGAWAYTRQLAADKNHGARLADLPADRVMHMVSTINNRANAITGKGHPARRNKKQRATPPQRPCTMVNESKSLSNRHQDAPTRPNWAETAQ